MVFEREYALEDVLPVPFVVQRIYCTQSHAMPSFSEVAVGFQVTSVQPRPPPSLSFFLLPRVRMEVLHVVPLPVTTLNDEQGAAEVEQALAARRNHRFNHALVKGKGKRKDEDDSSSECENEGEQPQEPVVPVKVEGPVLALTESLSEVKQALYRFMYLFENQRGCVAHHSRLAFNLTLKAAGHGLDSSSLTRR